MITLSIKEDISCLNFLIIDQDHARTCMGNQPRCKISDEGAKWNVLKWMFSIVKLLIHVMLYQVHKKLMGLAGFILCVIPANERRRYYVTSSLIGWAHPQKVPWACNISHEYNLHSRYNYNNAEWKTYRISCGLYFLKWVIFINFAVAFSIPSRIMKSGAKSVFV